MTRLSEKFSFLSPEGDDYGRKTGTSSRTPDSRRSSSSDSTVSDEDEPLSEEQSNLFLSELEGDSAEVDDIKSLNDLIIKPHDGSLIMAFKDPKRRTKAHIVKMATDSFLPNIVPIIFSDDVPMEMYIIFRLVLPHKKALAVAEKIGTIAREQNLSATQVLAEISGMDIKKRSDLKQVMLKALNYHPHIGNTLKSFFSKVQTYAK